MNKKEYFLISVLIGVILGAVIVYFAYQSDRASMNSTGPSIQAQSKYQVYSVDIPKNVAFAGEPLPLSKPDVLERLDREIQKNTFYHSSTILTIKRTSRIFPEFSKILKQYGIPDDFKYLAVAESNLKNVTSPVGAVGYWQFMEGTGRQYGLEISRETDGYGQPLVDERLDPIKATHAACRYLKDMHEKLGNWTNVAASYNRGVNAFARAQKKQKVESYYDLRLNKETARYIFRIVALKEVMSKPQKYGFNVNKKHYYAPLKYETVEVDTAIENLVDFAHSFEVTYKTLRIYNPWLNSVRLPNKSGKKYIIKLPIEKDLQSSKEGIKSEEEQNSEEAADSMKDKQSSIPEVMTEDSLDKLKEGKDSI